MEGVTLTVADLAMVFGPMLAALFAMMRYQHVDNSKTRDLMYKLIGESNRENRELIRENRELIEKIHQELSQGLEEVRSGLGEVRERLSYIEGFLRQSPPPPNHEGNAEAA